MGLSNNEADGVLGTSDSTVGTQMQSHDWTRFMVMSYIRQVGVSGIIEVGQVGPVAVCENEILHTDTM